MSTDAVMLVDHQSLYPDSPSEHSILPPNSPPKLIMPVLVVTYL